MLFPLCFIGCSYSAQCRYGVHKRTGGKTFAGVRRTSTRIKRPPVPVCPPQDTRGRRVCSRRPAPRSCRGVPARSGALVAAAASPRPRSVGNSDPLMRRVVVRPLTGGSRVPAPLPAFSRPVLRRGSHASVSLDRYRLCDLRTRCCTNTSWDEWRLSL